MQRDGFLIVLEEETEKQKLQRSCFLRLIDVRPTSLRSSNFYILIFAFILRNRDL